MIHQNKSNHFADVEISFSMELLEVLNNKGLARAFNLYYTKISSIRRKSRILPDYFTPVLYNDRVCDALDSPPSCKQYTPSRNKSIKSLRVVALKSGAIHLVFKYIPKFSTFGTDSTTGTCYIRPGKTSTSCKIFEYYDCDVYGSFGGCSNWYTFFTADVKISKALVRKL